MPDKTAKQLSQHPVHLGLGATAEAEPLFTGEISWYQDYGVRHQDDGIEGRLVNLHSFSAPWDMWEMHPNGAEVVLCTEGAITLIQENPDGLQQRIDLAPGQYAINPPGVWHSKETEAQHTIAAPPGTATSHSCHAKISLFITENKDYFSAVFKHLERMVMYPEDHPLNGPHPTDCSRC